MHLCKIQSFPNRLAAVFSTSALGRVCKYPFNFIAVRTLLPVTPEESFFRTSEGMKEISTKVTQIMRHEDSRANWMTFEHIYNTIRDARRFQGSGFNRDDLAYMFSRYTRRYMVKQDDGETFYLIVPGRHAPHEDPRECTSICEIQGRLAQLLQIMFTHSDTTLLQSDANKLHRAYGSRPRLLQKAKALLHIAPCMPTCRVGVLFT